VSLSVTLGQVSNDDGAARHKDYGERLIQTVDQPVPTLELSIWRHQEAEIQEIMSPLIVSTAKVYLFRIEAGNRLANERVIKMT